LYLQSALGINLPRCIGRAHFNQRLIPADTCLSRAAMTRYILMLWIAPGIISTATLIEIKCLARSLAFPERWHGSSVPSCRDKNLLTKNWKSKIYFEIFSSLFPVSSQYARIYFFSTEMAKFKIFKADHFFTFLQFSGILVALRNYNFNNNIIYNFNNLIASENTAIFFRRAFKILTLRRFRIYRSCQGKRRRMISLANSALMAFNEPLN